MADPCPKPRQQNRSRLSPPAEPQPPVAASPAPSLPSRDGSSADAPSLDADLRHQLSFLQAQVATLQAQVTELALALVRSSLPLTPPTTTCLACSAPQVGAPVTRAAPSEAKPPRARSRALPLIQSRSDGTYVAISPDLGLLSFVPDSPQWFEWLASLTSFTFQGAQGRFSAERTYRNGQRIQSWSTHRSFHGRSHTFYLGLTRSLTVAHLEHMAVAVHTYPTTL